MAYAIGAVVSGSATDPCCCAADCCLYPAAGFFDSSYPNTDLPDAINLLEPGGGYAAFTHSGDIFTGSYTTDDGTYDGEVRCEEVAGIPKWILYLDFGSGFVATGTVWECLIYSDGSPSDPVTDDFSDTLDVDSIFLESPVTVTRANLCEWIYDESGVYVRVYYDSDTYQWKMEIIITESPYNLTKDDPQDGPVGDYDTGDATVSVP